jgi:hypothetical protein
VSTISAAVLRACLKSFLGEPEYRKFLEAGAADPMKFWQERVWRAFVAEHPEMAVTPQERSSVLNVCCAHEVELLVGYTDSPEGYTFSHPPEERRDFPYAPQMPLIATGVNCVKYCPQCLSAKAEYVAARYK